MLLVAAKRTRSERRVMIWTNNDRTTLGVAAALWAAAAGSAITIGYLLNQPLHDANVPAHGLTPFAAALITAGWMGLVGVLFGRRLVPGSLQPARVR
jgi:hypothetical protein